MASKKKDDDLMFGDRLMPGPAPFPPAPGPIPPGPVPPGPVPPGPPPAPGPYPTCQFIDERFGILRNEHTGIKSIALDIKRVGEESAQALTDVKNIATTGFGAVDTAIGGVKTDIEGEVTKVAGKVDGVSGAVSGGFNLLGQQVGGVENAVLGAIGTEAENIKDGVDRVGDKVDNISTNTIPGAVSGLQDYIRDRKDNILRGQTEIRNHIEDDIRSALGMESTRSRTPIWDKIDGVETKVDTCNGTAGRVETAVGGVASTASRIEGALSTMNGSLSTFSGTLATIGSNAADAAEAAEAAARDASAIKTAITDSSYGLSALGTTIGNIENSISLQNTRLDTLTTQVTALTASVTTLTEVVSNLLVAIGVPTQDSSGDDEGDGGDEGDEGGEIEP